MSKTAIMGFGNPCRSDDGIGCYVIEQLAKTIKDDHETVSLFDMGTSAFEVLFQLKGHDKIIIVDAVINSGHEAGTLFKLPAEEIEAAIIDDPMVFLHGLKWDQALSYAKKMLREEYPTDITVFLIAVDNLKLDIDLSKPVKDSGGKVLEYIFEELELLNA